MANFGKTACLSDIRGHQVFTNGETDLCILSIMRKCLPQKAIEAPLKLLRASFMDPSEFGQFKLTLHGNYKYE